MADIHTKVHLGMGLGDRDHFFSQRPVNQVCALAKELGVPADWLLLSDALEALEQANRLNENQRARMRTLALKIMNSPLEVIIDVENRLHLDES